MEVFFRKTSPFFWKYYLVNLCQSHRCEKENPVEGRFFSARTLPFPTLLELHWSDGSANAWKFSAKTGWMPVSVSRYWAQLSPRSHSVHLPQVIAQLIAIHLVRTVSMSDHRFNGWPPIPLPVESTRYAFSKPIHDLKLHLTSAFRRSPFPV